MNHLLFSYGTLKNLRIQRELFGQTLPSRVGWIKGWGLYVGNEGYLFVKPHPGETLNGVVLTLSDRELETADRWEDLSVYDRERCHAFGGEERFETVWLYTQRRGSGVRVTSNNLPVKSDSDILADIRDMKKQFGIGEDT